MRRLISSILVIVTVLVVPSRLPAQENTLAVVFDQDPYRNTVVGVFRTHGLLYASLTDLAEVFQLNIYENRTTRKLEVRRGQDRVTVTAGNPFVTVSDPAQQKSVFQLPADVIFGAGSYFVPLNGFLPYLRIFSSRPVEYDQNRNILRVRGGPVMSPFDVPLVVLEEKSNGMMIRIVSRKKVEDVESWLRQDGWLYVTLVDVKADLKTLNAVKPLGIIRKVVAIQSPTSVQISFKLNGPVAATEVIREDASSDILISIRTEQPVADKTPPAPVKGPETVAPLETKRRREPPPALAEQRKRWELDVIVLDAGHGGHDPGTIGVTGVREKDITLGVALKLGKLIKQSMPDVKVVYTRSADVFIPLYRRGQIANEAGGKLFVSIHGNSMPRKPHPSSGFEVYLLRPGRTEEAIAIAERENSVIQLEDGYEDRYKELTDENFILVTMAQSQYVKSSEVLADLVQGAMHRVVGLPNRGVHQAGFYVLVGAAMPNILLETGYLSNRNDERFLKSASGQQKIAEAVLRAIQKYKGEYEKLLTVGKEEARRTAD